MSSKPQDTYTVPKFPKAETCDLHPLEAEVAKLRDERVELVAALSDTHRILCDLPAGRNYQERIQENRRVLSRLGSAA